MMRKLFFLLVIICLNCSCSTTDLDTKTSDHLVKETTESSGDIIKENAALRRERRREMVLARIDQMDKNQ